MIWAKSIYCISADETRLMFSRDPLPIFHPEFGRYMLEATPGKPWGIGFKDLLDVEPNMKLRYGKVLRINPILTVVGEKLPKNI